MTWRGVLMRRMRHIRPVTPDFTRTALDAYMMNCVQVGNEVMVVIAIALLETRCAPCGWRSGQHISGACGG